VADIGTLDGLSPEDALRLRRVGVGTVDQLWARVGSDKRRGFQTLADASGVQADRLVETLARAGDRAARGAPFWSPERWWLEGSFLALVLFVGVLALRAVGGLGVTSTADRAPGSPRVETGVGVPVPIGVETVVIAADDLEVGRPLRPTDLTTARMTPSPLYFSDPARLIGTVLATPIGRGRPVRTADVTRAQVVASKDIPLGASITADVVSMKTTPYDRDAALSPADVVGRRALTSISASSVVLNLPSHIERPDFTGRPGGQAGRQIPR
jgi:flagella basal body P-ring formation protein FlgA